MKLGVVVLAAGKGTRMRSALPKVLHRLAGRPLLGHVLDAAAALGAAQVCVVYGHGGDQVPAAFPQAKAHWVEQTQRLGTGHAVMQAMPAMAAMDRVLVLYGDVPLIEPETLNRLVDDSAATRLGLLTMDLADPTGYGRIVRDKSDRVLRIVEHKDASAAERAISEVNTGIIVAERASLDHWLSRIGNDNVQREYYLTDVIGLAVGDGVEVATTAAETLEEVAGVNDRAQLAELERHFQRGIADQLMLGGTTVADPARLDVRGSLICDQDVVLDVNLVCEGRVRIGANCRIGPNCILKDCTLGPGVEVMAHSIIEGASVAAGARIGPFARLRPGSAIAEDCHIGNFVEVKKARIAAGTKINHLSYIGDAEIGAGVNVGAGTITCNYDGANKHLTRIGDRAFIGSNTALVAPVAVGPGATIGAGSVINRDAPPDQLTLTRAQQTTIEHWQRPTKQPEPGPE
jgi:bifunctional UDP-N-acetylglucosamine pyrophosphorylase/glucosamine-1-phosphate N-acetyltransferase